MKIKALKTAGYVILCTGILTGCSSIKEVRMEQPYDFQARLPALDEAVTTTCKADSFAADLCVIMDEAQYQDSSVSAEAAVVFDMNDESVLYSKQAFEKLYPASITKIMTALILLKQGNLSDEVTVTEDAVITESGATLCGIKPGDKLTLEQLLYGLMLPSGNDAGAAIAVHMAGSISAFSDLMNEEAKKLGATGTHFTNPHGLNDEQHYTTAYDLYLIFNEALKQPLFRDVISATSYTANYLDIAGNAVSKTWPGGNWYMTGKSQPPAGVTVFGGKTGTTKAAGYCLIMVSQDEEGKEYISVVLKAGSRNGLYENMTNIIRKIVE